MKDVDVDSFSDVVRERRFSLGEQCIFYDSEFRNIFNIVKDLSDVVNSIKKRIQYKDVSEISRSKFMYFDYLKNRHLYPEIVFSFRNDKDECKVVRVRKEYFVYCSWIGIDDERVWRNNPHILGSYKLLGEAIGVFNDCVYEYQMRLHDVLF